MAIQKFRKKPVVIEAIQYTNFNKDEIEQFVGNSLQQELETEAAWLAGSGIPMFSIYIETLEGKMKILPNDWVIKGVNGEFYPCKPDIFIKTYEPIE